MYRDNNFFGQPIQLSTFLLLPPFLSKERLPTKAFTSIINEISIHNSEGIKGAREI
jgi:hypothetical protein